MNQYPLASRINHSQNTVVNVNGIVFGGNKIVLMGGPCAVESREQLQSIANKLLPDGVNILRGGAYKPRTSPYSFQGLHQDGLTILREVAKNTPIISEITRIDSLSSFEDVDIIQVGARNMQNYELLSELGKINKPILLKRGFANTVEELLMSAEYILRGGNKNVILCERGIRTFDNNSRYSLDISSIPIIKSLSHLPVVVDPSHASGANFLVEPLSLASIAAGADGLLIEVHDKPELALSDGAQSITPEQFYRLKDKILAIAKAIGRELI